MTKFDFQTVPDRSHTDSVKWDVKPGELPMWIADMDFKTAPAITKAMAQKIKLAAFGYEFPRQDYFKAVADWYEKEHQVRPQEKWMIFTTGVVPAISSIVRRIAHMGDNVLVQEPVYNIFFNSIENNGRHVLSSDLVFNGHDYEIDWQDLERKLALPLTTLMIFCNPHNPVGKVWTQEQVQRLADLCYQHHVTLLSDEIHGDLVRYGTGYYPAFGVKGKALANIISLVSPSKTFNVAALHAATAIVPGENLRAMVNRGLNSDEVAEPNLLAIPATIAAYENGHEWLHALLKELNQNFAYAAAFIKKNLPMVKVISGPATYLMWLDTAAISKDAEKLAHFIREKTGLIVSAGSIYRSDGHDFLRVNLACPISLVKDGMQRLATGIKAYQKQL